MAEVKKEIWFKRTWGGICKYFRELKKVVWSTPKQVLKNCLIVCACVLVVGVFIWLFDFTAEFVISKLLSLAA